MINLLAVGLVFVGAFLGGVGAVLVKKGADTFSLRRIWKNWRNRFLMIGLFLYAISTIMYMIALRWEELSVLYPMVSMSYLWIVFFSIKFLGEKMNNWKWLGLLGIILGIILISLGS